MITTYALYIILGMISLTLVLFVPALGLLDSGTNMTRLLIVFIMGLFYITPDIHVLLPEVLDHSMDPQHLVDELAVYGFSEQEILNTLVNTYPDALIGANRE